MAIEAWLIASESQNVGFGLKGQAHNPLGDSIKSFRQPGAVLLRKANEQNWCKCLIHANK